MSAPASLERATTRPARSTVTRSATRRTSASLCVTSTTARRSPATRAQTSSKPSISSGRSTAVGSSSRSSRGLADQAFTISTRCRSPTDRSCDRRRGSTAGRAAREARARRRRSRSRRSDAARLAEQQVLDDASGRPTRLKCWCTIATPAPARRRGRRGGGAPPSRIRRASGVHAEDDVAQRRLAGAVLAEQAVDLAGGNLERAPSSAARPPKRLPTVDREQRLARSLPFRQASAFQRLDLAFADRLLGLHPPSA